MRVRVHRNVHRGDWSVKTYVDIGGRNAWRVTDHVDRICLLEPTFHVSEAGRQRVLRERKKNVHAYVAGIVAPNSYAALANLVRASYNPYVNTAFVVEARNSVGFPMPMAIKSAKVAWLADDGKLGVEL